MVQVDEFGLTAGEFPSHWAQDGRHAHHPTISDTLLLMTAQADPLEQIVGDDLSFEATLQPEPNSICVMLLVRGWGGPMSLRWSWGR